MIPEADEDRRFGGLRRLYGDAAYERLRRLHVTVVGVGGVGSWCAEALARSGVARLSLVDLDHVAESNINRQVQATTETLGAAKVQALGQRIQGIHPGCALDLIEEFVGADTWPMPAASEADVVIDACDDPRAKLALALWALDPAAPGRRLVVSGAAGGKRQPHRTEVADLSAVTHDPLLAGLRQRLRKSGVIPAAGAGKRPGELRAGLPCVFSREAVAPPTGADQCSADGSLNCHGYGSSVTVTAAFGLAAAACAIDLALQGLRAS